MAGRIVVSTLNNDTGVLATQNGMTGIAKAWVNFNGTGTVAIRDSFNVSSITDNGTGNYTVNFTTAMPNANYSWSSVSGSAGVTNGFTAPSGTPLSTALTLATINVATQNIYDPILVCVAVFSS
jgi:hypothetical protein